jgi:ATP-grasp domain/CoA binding domain
VAVIGASADPSKVGGSVLANLKAGGFPGRLVAVNAARSVVQGLSVGRRRRGRAVAGHGAGPAVRPAPHGRLWRHLRGDARRHRDAPGADRSGRGARDADGAADGAGLHGFRGRPAADLDALADTVSRFSHLVSEVPDLRELEINPLLATPAGARALDVRGRLSTEEE